MKTIVIKLVVYTVAVLVLAAAIGLLYLLVDTHSVGINEFEHSPISHDVNEITAKQQPTHSI